MASYGLNTAAVDHARALISGRQYTLDSDWGDSQPGAAGAERLPREAFMG